MTTLGLLLPTILIIITTISFFISFNAASSSPSSSATDTAALLAVKSQLLLPTGSPLATNWSSDRPTCSWLGVTCTSDLLRRVTAVNLSALNLVGALPPDIGNLSFLTSLDLRLNSFRSSIPPELFRLPRLEYVDLSSNGFSGAVPGEAFSAPALRVLSLQRNSLVGSLRNATANASSSLREIRLGKNSLTGEIPAEIFRHLPYLEIFSASLNNFSGSVPMSIFWCRRLQLLSLSFNELRGRIPMEVGNLTGLEVLFLGSNYFTGAIPLEIADLVNLQYLNLESNTLTSQISPSLTNLTNLLLLGFAHNNLTGRLPQELGTIPGLQFLDVKGNELTGSLPPNIFNISSLIHFGLSRNRFTGSLPPADNINLPNLVDLILHHNSLSGSIPPSILNSSSLDIVDISVNRFSGVIPNEFSNLRILKSIIIYGNNLTIKSPETFFCSLSNCESLKYLVLGENPLNTFIPSCIGNLSSTLEFLSMNLGNLRGGIPQEIGSLSNVSRLELQENNFSGTIPDTIGRMQKLQGFYAGTNKLEGPIPLSICQLSSISELLLDGNELTGSIPSCLGNLISLRKLSLAKNRLNMVIPSSLWKLTDILQLDLSWNSLSGPLSPNIGNLKVATSLNLSHNQLTGDIPSTLDNLQDIQILSLANNELQGSIPQSFGDLISLEFLDLSNNDISGAIPPTLEKLSNLKYFNVSFNKLEGQVPNGGPFDKFSAASFISNGHLCGSARLQLPLCKNVITRRKNRVFVRLIIPIGASILGLGFVVLILILLRRRKRNNANSPKKADEDLPLAIWRNISYNELLQATKRFNESNLLGAGSFGSVYKGTLFDGTDIAVKVFNLQAERSIKSFYAECEVLKNIRHMNLVKVITCYSSADLKCLVLEYIPNGTLEEWLYSDSFHLDLLHRLSIMIDVAAAIEYLHHGNSQPIIHCDLKPSNVLLDEDMNGRVTDFGISKLLGEGDDIAQTLTLSTIGYTAPEYGLEGIVSTGGDVYSYGLLLMETFTAKRPTDEMFVDGMNLKEWVKQSLLSDSVHHVADSVLLNIKEHDFLKKKACLSAILELALRCCAEKREDRMDMKDVSKTLNKIKANSFVNGKNYDWSLYYA